MNRLVKPGALHSIAKSPFFFQSLLFTSPLVVLLLDQAAAQLKDHMTVYSLVFSSNPEIP